MPRGYDIDPGCISAAADPESSVQGDRRFAEIPDTRRIQSHGITMLGCLLCPHRMHHTRVVLDGGRAAG